MYTYLYYLNYLIYNVENPRKIKLKKVLYTNKILPQKYELWFFRWLLLKKNQKYNFLYNYFYLFPVCIVSVPLIEKFDSFFITRNSSLPWFVSTSVFDGQFREILFFHIVIIYKKRGNDFYDQVVGCIASLSSCMHFSKPKGSV